MTTGRDIMKYWPVALVAAGAIASGAVDSFRINSNAEELKDLSENIDENEDAVEEIQRLLIQRQGDVELTIQDIRNQQNNQAEQLDEIIQLLRDSARNQ